MIWFEQQFNKREKIESYAGTVEFLDITSPYVRTSHTVFIIFGWGETFQSVKPTLASIASRGYRVIVGMYERLDKNIRNTDRHPAVEYVKAQAIADILKYKNIQKIDVIAHSEGAIIASLLVQLKPGIIKSLTLISPAGLASNINVQKISFKFLVYLFKEFLLYLRGEYKAGLIYIGGLFRYIFLNPIQSFREIIGISTFKINPILNKLNKKGGSIFMIYSSKDSLFSSSEIEAVFKEIKFKKIYEISGVHNELHLHPGKLVDVFDDIFNIHQAGIRPEDIKQKRKFFTVITDTLYFITRKSLGLLVRLIWVKKVTGIENIPKKGPAIIAFNHESYFDFICFIAVSPRNVYYLAAEKFFINPFWKILMYATGQIRVNRTKKDKRNVHDLVSLHLNEGKIIGIFPEGTRAPSKDIMLKAFSGVAKYTIKEKVPVIPVGLKGAFDVMSRFDKIPKLTKKVEINIGKPVNFNHYHIKFNHKGYIIFTDKIMNEISKLSQKPYPQRDLNLKKYA
ncbi:MAG: hypothetical protein RJA61_131 [Candidatus Parcubacteria bacterium]|jgi:1-acyl-sn-glycerol-3-phosphate acyltransferase